MWPPGRLGFGAGTLSDEGLWDHRTVAVIELIPDDVAARVPTAPLAATGLIAGFAVAVGSGSRPVGGAVMAAFGLTCMAVWLRRDGARVTAGLTAAGLCAFAGSHLLAKAIGAWPSVLTVSAATAALCWRFSDARRTAS
jgi:hypothetical protein